MLKIRTHSPYETHWRVSKTLIRLGQFSFNEDGDGVYEPNILIVRDGILRFLIN